MNKFSKIIVLGLFAALTSMSYAQGGHHHHGGPHPAPATDSAMQTPHMGPDGMPPCGGPHHGMPHNSSSIDAQTIARGFVHGVEMFAILDSVDNSIDIIANTPDSMYRVSREEVDVVTGVHDLTTIYYPRSVMMVGEQVIYLASNKDSSLVRVITAAPCGKINRDAELKFLGHCEAFSFEHGVMTIVGDNPSGYTLVSIDLKDGDFSRLNELNDSAAFADNTNHLNYRKPRKAEEIAQSDPVGVGLTVAAVSVVFLVLMILAILFTYYGKAIVHFQKRKAEKEAIAKGRTVDADAIEKAVDHSGDVDAAIAAAIFLFTEEMHDEENTVITIQKAERAWTPWNAKYYNMNQYFNKRR